MKLLEVILRLFVDDVFLAVAILAVVGLTAVLAEATDIAPMIAGTVLLGSCLAVLVLGVLRSARRQSRAPAAGQQPGQGPI